MKREGHPKANIKITTMITSATDFLIDNTPGGIILNPFSDRENDKSRPWKGARFGQNPSETSLSSPKAATPKLRGKPPKGRGEVCSISIPPNTMHIIRLGNDLYHKYTD